MFKKRLMASLPVCLLVVCFVRASVAAETLRIAYPSADVVFLPLWAGLDAGFFKKQHLVVELVSIRSSPIATALLSAKST